MTSKQQYIEQIRHSSREIVRELGLLSDETKAKLPLSFRHVLVETDIAGKLNQVDLSAQLRLDKSTVSRMVNKLGKMKLVTMITEQNDKRYKSIQLTDKGKEVADEIHHSAITQVGAALAQLSETEKTQVVLGLALYERALKQARIKYDTVRD